MTWASRTLAAQWAMRYLHTSVIDAAGAIYVIGGTQPRYQDVWVSTDGGARSGLRQGAARGSTRGTMRY